jgi:hypothetical protein
LCGKVTEFRNRRAGHASFFASFPVRGLQTIDPAYFCRPDPGSSNPAPESKSLLVLFFRKEQNLLFLKKKKQKDF